MPAHQCRPDAPEPSACQSQPGDQQARGSQRLQQTAAATSKSAPAAWFTALKASESYLQTQVSEPLRSARHQRCTEAQAARRSPVVASAQHGGMLRIKLPLQPDSSLIQWREREAHYDDCSGSCIKEVHLHSALNTAPLLKLMSVLSEPNAYMQGTASKPRWQSLSSSCIASVPLNVVDVQNKLLKQWQ